MPRKPTQKEIKSFFVYDTNTGIIINRVNRNKAREGERAGYINKGKRGNYRMIKLHGEKYQSAHIIWVYMTGKWPKEEVDHKNLIRDDDRWENLRESTRSQNCANKGQFFKPNAYGHRGVKRQPSGRFQAVICCKQIEYSLGTYNTIEEAARAYDVAAVKHHGEFARLNFPWERADGRVEQAAE